MADLVQDGLNRANPANIAALWNLLNMGDALKSMAAPVERARTSLASSATQVHDKAERIHTVTVAGTHTLVVSSGATPAANQVAITYDQDSGVPTLVFNSAVTQYEAMASMDGVMTVLAGTLA